MIYLNKVGIGEKEKENLFRPKKVIKWRLSEMKPVTRNQRKQSAKWTLMLEPKPNYLKIGKNGFSCITATEMSGLRTIGLCYLANQLLTLKDTKWKPRG